ncbi:hypothetical protein A1Q1_06230 [Trichosporon asahii var. asahii CBS 2479]|uniref:Uncharacterized protein n=1 Tax=Trichosporon asahii var. asahii (strain ATCC 90039 / CBS 2479 / JCM 2466 / KCTC 7840 / NBRC 103889/ NCYC 2677 / UAMH 7654) TaxID=1186058 RepID=J5Q3T8_TRIAS|nr:hypothetical protein A1Q1_06230 [Trichosporon asahii var. asahii CBS 2479]EJT45333.1 hypothetical protein A1Q1_06230 [Trichosporon asahii var. asahii CBS 2479]
MLWLALTNAATVAAQNPAFIDFDPPLTQCVKSTITWEGGTPPYLLGARVNIGSLRDIKKYINDTKLEWTCDFPAGTELEFYLNDSSGQPYENDRKRKWLARVRTNANGESCPIWWPPLKKADGSPMPITYTVTTTTAQATPGPSGDTAQDGSASTTKTSTNHTGQIVGGVVGGVVGLLIIGGLLFWIWRLRKRLRANRRNSYANIEDHTESARQTTVNPIAASAPSRPAPEPVQPTTPEPTREPSPPTKIMQLDTMYAPQPSPSALGSDSPGLFDTTTSSRSPPTRYTLDATSARTSTVPNSSSHGHAQTLSPIDDQRSEYAEDGGPAFPSSSRTIHPPQYSDTWKS